MKPPKYDDWRNLPEMFFERAAELADKPFLWAKKTGAYRPLSWRQTAQRVSALSRGLRALGIAAGDRVALVSENRPEFAIADFAVMAAGAITVPTYTTHTTRDHRHVLTDCGAKAVIVSSASLAARLLPAANDAREVRFVVTMEPVSEGAGLTVEIHSWDEVLTLGRERPDDVGEIVARAAPDDVACLIYTSGTGGNPKGVMLSHRAILFNCMGAHSLLEEIGLEDEVFLSFLPLSHSYEHTCGQCFPISIGAEIYYAQGIESLSANLLEARPTFMISVPRLYDMMRQRILHAMRREGGSKEKLFMKAVELGSRAYERRGGLRLTERFYDFALKRLVRQKVKERFGGRLKAMVSGGAPLNYEAGLFFTALGIRILQGYGQTEAAPVVSCNPPRRVKLKTVGPPLKDVEVKIAEDGEILVKGPLVMEGYWNNREASVEALRDGWLHTGDVGAFDEDGYLMITDRKKDIIVLSGGDNISPQRIEGILTLQPEIEQAMAHGDTRAHLVALIVPDPQAVERWAAAYGKEAKLHRLADDADFVEWIGKAIERANMDLSSIERIKRFTLAHEPFTVENGQLTPTLKVRRHNVVRIYGPALDALYGR
ncbi:MAG: long-chain fatty acid--CoA ligase [Alphaproteobacteria bacterium]